MRPQTREWALARVSSPRPYTPRRTALSSERTYFAWYVTQFQPYIFVPAVFRQLLAYNTQTLRNGSVTFRGLSCSQNTFDTFYNPFMIKQIRHRFWGQCWSPSSRLCALLIREVDRKQWWYPPCCLLSVWYQFSNRYIYGPTPSLLNDYLSGHVRPEHDCTPMLL